MGEFQPSRSRAILQCRQWARAIYRRIVRREPVYILPWIASSHYRTSILLENNQTAYMRRRSGVSTDTTVDIRRYDAAGRPVDIASHVVGPGMPVRLEIASEQRELEYGFVQFT